MIIHDMEVIFWNRTIDGIEYSEYEFQQRVARLRNLEEFKNYDWRTDDLYDPKNRKVITKEKVKEVIKEPTLNSSPPKKKTLIKMFAFYKKDKEETY